ncbi:hypothetical protein LRR80_01170 [Streptomyces sp. RO-S4]|uniref:hypothetical protein n=2 Tax=Streptomyces TaxID=1883 RepID=UPI00208FE4E3|nr:hypothetical protein [Streptomyces sp. RO-S4]MCO4695122.1 hypothetical protein [Streptomyces sp. RO-S4]
MTYGLTRLLRTEDDWSDLLCLLAELDPEPLRSALLLAPGRITVRREALVKAGRGAPAGRADLIVLLDDIERTVMEVKLGAGAHGDQFAAYDAWADVKGIPVSARYLVGPNADPIPNEPSHWSRQLTVVGLLASWNRSPDDLARLLSVQALQQFTQLEAEATGPASQASIALSDALRLRRLASITQATAPPGTIFEPKQRSEAGAANICAWRKTADGYVVTEIQRLNPRSPRGGTGTPFEIRIMVGIPGATPEADGELADRHRSWLARRSFVRYAGSTVQAMVVAPEDDGFKTEKSRGKGHPRYYGYKGGGQGSSTVLRSTVDLNDMVIAFSGALQYLTTYPEQ